MSGSLLDSLPDSLNLSPHLSAQKYFLVCSLTVAAWDTLVLSPRTWRLLRTPGWPPLKILFHFMRVFMPVEWIVASVAFFDTRWTLAACQKFFLFEPICTAILLACASAVHVIRIHAIYDKSRSVLFGMGGLFALQIVVTAVCCGFFRSVPLKATQGCISGPKANWVGIYWVVPTLLYCTSFGLALVRSIRSLANKPLSPWKLMLRDGLNLYAAIALINLVNMLFWFIITPTGPEDPIKTIVNSMANVLTVSMTMRIILSVRGTLVNGGVFSGSAAATATTGSSSRTTGPTGANIHTLTTHGADIATNPNGIRSHTYTLDDMHAGKPEQLINDDQDNKSTATTRNGVYAVGPGAPVDDDLKVDVVNGLGVKVTIDREVGYDSKHGYDEQPYPRPQ